VGQLTGERLVAQEPPNGIGEVLGRADERIRAMRELVASRPDRGRDHRHARGEVRRQLEIGPRAAHHRVQRDVGEGEQRGQGLVVDDPDQPHVRGPWAIAQGPALAAGEQELHVGRRPSDLEHDLRGFEIRRMPAPQEQSDPLSSEPELRLELCLRRGRCEADRAGVDAVRHDHQARRIDAVDPAQIVAVALRAAPDEPAGLTGLRFQRSDGLGEIRAHGTSLRQDGLLEEVLDVVGLVHHGMAAEGRAHGRESVGMGRDHDVGGGDRARQPTGIFRRVRAEERDTDVADGHATDLLLEPGFRRLLCRVLRDPDLS